MATIQSPPNSVWPNGLQTDSEGYVNFYPLGTNKVDISTITWPEGNKVNSPFVYQDDKLVGFIDTKALEIDNNDTTIDINYTHFDADLDSIIENTLTINAPENATVNVNYGAVDKILTEKIEKVLGKENCEVKFDKNNNKATIAVALDTTEAQIAEIKSLLNRVLPPNLVTEMEWADGLPMTYTRLEYLGSSGMQWIDTGITATNNTGLYAEWMFNGRTTSSNNKNQHVLSCVDLCCPHPQSVTTNNWFAIGTLGSDATTFKLTLGEKNISSTNFQNLKTINFNETSVKANKVLESVQGKVILCSYPNLNSLYNFSGYIYSAKISEGAEIVRNFIPCLNDIGTPGMYDTVNKIFKTNAGTMDFFYPTDAAPAMSAGLVETFYAKLTEHGMRRLYHVPTGCTMTKDEYAAANGFKELVEPPMPLEGYWVPEWRETETQLICDWVETEPPTEEI